MKHSWINYFQINKAAFLNNKKIHLHVSVIWSSGTITVMTIDQMVFPDEKRCCQITESYICLWLWCLTSLSTIFQLYRGGQFIGGGKFVLFYTVLPIDFHLVILGYWYRVYRDYQTYCRGEFGRSLELLIQEGI